MTWPCFYCTYDNEDDSATQCCLCGMPGNRTFLKEKAVNNKSGSDSVVDLTATNTNAEGEGSVSITTSTIDLTASINDNNNNNKSERAFVSKRKRNFLSNEAKSNGENTNDSSSSSRKPERNFHSSLKRRKPPTRPTTTTTTTQQTQQQPRQSTLSFSSVSKPSSSSHGHTFAHKVVPLDDPIRTGDGPKSQMQKVLETVFGLKSLRKNLQPAAIACAMRGKSQMIVMATGGGKSLCYQLPACLLGGVTVVISPLLALMKDQTEALKKKEIPASCINSSQTEKENKAILERLVPSLYPRSLGAKQAGQTKENPAVLLYVTPESIQTERMRAVLKTLYKEDRLALFAVDEAHCLSTWGHDFRSSYRRLNYLRTAFPKTPCMALTATATPKVIKDVVNELSLQKCPLHIGSFDRPNIFYKVKYKDSLDKPLEELVKYVKGRHASSKKKLSENGSQNGAEECSGIVYVHKREETSMIARAISKAGITASPYHAGLKKVDRATVQEGWSSGKIQVAVATVAFGMGIDRHCVRYVVHWSLPKTIEGFYQEAGRAGRDGKPSHSLLFYSPTDVGKYKYLIRMQGSKSNKKGDTAGDLRAAKNTERKLEQLEEMQEYCTQMKCRRNALIRHFGGKPVDCKNTCDFCKDPKKVERSMHASTAIKDVRSQQRKLFGKQNNKTKQPWSGQWNKPHGDFGEDENAIASDWGDNCLMAGDLRVTGPSGADPDDYSSSAPVRKGGGFAKASDILSKYESMEGRYGGTSSNNTYGGGDDPPRKKIRSINIPEHLKASLKAASDFTTANNILPPKKKATKPLTSTDHGKKAKEIEERLNKMKAEREKRLKALQAKTAKKPPPPPPAPLSFGRRKGT